MLKDWPAEAVLPARDLDRAGRFYRDFLGMTIEQDAAQGMLAVEAGNGTYFELHLSGSAPCDHEALTFHVRDLKGEVDRLKDAGIRLEDRDQPKTTEGIADVGGILTAWFHDSEGNVIALREG